MSNVKIKLRSGNHEIELEGGREDVDALLDRWWSNADELDAQVRSGAQNTKDAAALSRRKKAAKRIHTDTVPDASGPDVNAVANELKQDQRFSKFHAVLLGSNLLRKIILICWFVQRPLSSGELKKILEQLGIKASLTGISSALSRNIKDFIVDKAAQVPRYHLTAGAVAKFESTLKSEVPKSE